MSDSNLSPSTPDDQADASASGAFDFYVEQLETYLDGELEPAEAETVRQRLAQEPAYAASLARLKAQRHLRIDTLSQDGDDAAAARLNQCACALAAPGEASPMRIGPAKHVWWLGLAAAACVMAGFGVGTFSGLDFGTSPAPIMSNPIPAGDNPGLVSNPGDDEATVQPADNPSQRPE
ncbi:MAG: hypothetical protein AAGI46_07420 [Planctomycetota bacterium]